MENTNETHHHQPEVSYLENLPRVFLLQEIHIEWTEWEMIQELVDIRKKNPAAAAA